MNDLKEEIRQCRKLIVIYKNDWKHAKSQFEKDQIMHWLQKTEHELHNILLPKLKSAGEGGVSKRSGVLENKPNQAGIKQTYETGKGTLPRVIVEFT